MAYDKVASEALSNQWRDYCNNLDDATRLQMIASMKEATSVKSERNVRLWFDNGANYRKILNKTLSADEYALRERIVRAALRLNNENVPLKTASGKSARQLNARKFAEYVKDSYTGRFTRAITFTENGFLLSYDTYGNMGDGDGDFDDEDFIEFYDEDFLPDDVVEEFF